MSNDEERDAGLLNAWRGGDRAAGEQLFDRYADSIARFFENKVRRGAEDLTQATFVRMLEGRDRIEGNSFRSYYFGVARNVMREHIRELVRGRDVDPNVESMATLAPGPSTAAGLRQEHRLMLEGLRRLSINDQILLELFYWEEFKTHEIAEFLGIPPSTARRRLSTARAALDTQMAALAASPALADRTSRHFDSWIADIRQKMGARR